MIQSSSSDDSMRHCNIKILSLFDPELPLINTKPSIKNKLKELLGELKKFKVKTILVLENKKIDYHKSMSKVFHSSVKLLMIQILIKNLDRCIKAL